MGKYVIQFRKFEWDPWKLCPGYEFDTLEEAMEALERIQFKSGYRIAEAYTVTRYKAVKRD